MPDARPAIVGVGNVLMSDDGVGPSAVEALRRRGADARADLLDAGLAFGEVLCDLDPSAPLVILDAARGGGPAGTVYRLGPDDLADSGSMSVAVSLHETSVVPSLQLQALAGREFADVTLFGVEPARTDVGEGLSPPVAQAVEKLVQAVCQFLDERAAHPQPVPDLPAGRQVCAAAPARAARGSENR